MTTQTYLIIENNVVTNVCLWDGNLETWTPPTDSIQLIQSITPCMLWEPVMVNGEIVDFKLVELIGYGSLNDTWDGSVLTTNLPKPTLPISKS